MKFANLPKLIAPALLGTAGALIGCEQKTAPVTQAGKADNQADATAMGIRRHSYPESNEHQMADCPSAPC